MSNKVKIKGVHINLDEAAKVEDLKSLEIFENEEDYDTLKEKIEARKVKAKELKAEAKELKAEAKEAKAEAKAEAKK